MDGSHMRLCPLPVSASLSTPDTSPVPLRCWFIKAKDITSPKHISLLIWGLKASAPKVLSSYLYILFLWISFTPDFQLSTLNEDSLLHSVAPIHFPSFISQFTMVSWAPPLQSHPDLKYNIPNTLPEIPHWSPSKPVTLSVLTVSGISHKMLELLLPPLSVYP